MESQVMLVQKDNLGERVHPEKSFNSITPLIHLLRSLGTELRLALWVIDWMAFIVNKDFLI